MMTEQSRYLDDLTGRMLMIGFEGETFSPSLRNLLGSIRPAGIILFKRNVGGGPGQVAGLVRACQEFALEEFGRPLLVAIDEEGGPVRRLGPPFTQKPPQRQMAGTMTPGEVEDLARRCGREMAAVGINFNLAPVLDLSVDPAATFMYERTFGADPDAVSRFGLALVRGYHSRSILTCAKHFPGIGDTRLDPHEVLPAVNHSEERLRSLELIPFERAVKAGIDAVMTSHINYPGLDPHQPVTFSEKITTTMLRNELGFEGLILSDDLEMGAIVKHYHIGPACVKAVASGNDMILVCQREDRIHEAYSALTGAVRSGEIRPARLEASSRRLQTALDGISLPGESDWQEVFDEQ